MEIDGVGDTQQQHVHPQQLKRSRSYSDMNQFIKRRVPSTYTPSHPLQLATISSEGLHLGGLHLATPPGLSPVQSYTATFDDMDMNEGDVLARSVSETPLYPIPPRRHHSAQRIIPTTMQYSHSLPTSPGRLHRRLSPTFLPPHHAPYLASHLAGSPPPSSFTPASLYTSSSSSGDSLHDSGRMTTTPPPSAASLPLRVGPEYAQLPPSPPRRQEVKVGYKLTMGYRSDCVRCQNAEVNHYQHLELIVPGLEEDNRMIY